MGKGKCKKPSFTLVMISPQLCSVHTCVLIWSPPTHLSMRAPPWGPSPPPPSLSTWTTKQRRGTSSTCLVTLFCLLLLHHDWLLISSLSPWCKSATQREGLWICHTQCKHCPRQYHLCSDVTWSYWWWVSWTRWLSWLDSITSPIDKHMVVSGWATWCGGLWCLSFSKQEMKTKFPGSVASQCFCRAACHKVQGLTAAVHRQLDISHEQVLFPLTSSLQLSVTSHKWRFLALAGSFWALCPHVSLFPHLSLCPAVSDSAYVLRLHCVTCPVLSLHQSPAALTLLCQLLS